MAKADMIKEAEDLGIQLEGNETISDLSDLIKEAKASAPADLKGPIPEGAPPEPEPEDKQVGGVVLRRRSVNRGSTRRIAKARDDLAKAFDAFKAAVDPHVFVVDDNGARIGHWPFVDRVTEMNQELQQATNALFEETQ